MQTGKVRWFSYSKGCGFIIADDGGSDVFAHFSEFADAGLASLSQNDRVRYRVSRGPLGPVANCIRRLVCLPEDATC